MAGEIGEVPASGLGKLIQDERFSVPTHQRDYSWSVDEVTLLLDDIEAAIDRGDKQYFVGLMVFLGSDEPQQIVLDGQQRLATAIIYFSAVRNWLGQYSHSQADAARIQDWFIGRHELGEREMLPRLILNTANHQTFLDYVVQAVPIADARLALSKLKRYDRNRKLLEATIYCYERIATLATKLEPEDLTRRLIKTVIYLRDSVSVVRLNVSNDDTAFAIFETLNDRGIELSPLDLVKNYLLRRGNSLSRQRLREMEDRWVQMMSTLSSVKADSFLKTFWTSRHGRVQATNLYAEYKRHYSDANKAVSASVEMLQVAEQYAALETSDDSIWAPHSPAARESVRSLKLLGGQQTHPVLLSALAKFDPHNMERLLRLLEIIIVRYQLIGGGRTGRLEIVCARLAQAIFNGEISDTAGKRKVNTTADVFREAREIYPSDETFKTDFASAQERNSQKAVYLLRHIEHERRRREPNVRADELEPGTLSLEHILPKNPGQGWQSTIQSDRALQEDCTHRIGNMCLLTKSDNRSIGRASFEEKKKVYSGSSLYTTNSVPASHPTWNRNSVDQRQQYMGDLAVTAWRFQ